jgi:hypothetical protein
VMTCSRRLAAIGAALLIGAAACGRGQKVYVQGKLKPKQIVLGAGTPIREIRWTSYGGPTATAEGMFAVNDCQRIKGYALQDC